MVLSNPNTKHSCFEEIVLKLIYREKVVNDSQELSNIKERNLERQSLWMMKKKQHFHDFTLCDNYYETYFQSSSELLVLC